MKYIGLPSSTKSSTKSRKNSQHKIRPDSVMKKPKKKQQKKSAMSETKPEKKSGNSEVCYFFDIHRILLYFWRPFCCEILT